MFNFNVFIKKGLMKAIGKMPDYQVMLVAAEWHDKGILTEADLTEIETVIDIKNAEAENETADNTDTSV